MAWPIPQRGAGGAIEQRNGCVLLHRIGVSSNDAGSQKWTARCVHKFRRRPSRQRHCCSQRTGPLLAWHQKGGAACETSQMFRLGGKSPYATS
eukprot:scaffold90121_cov30-Tisochrysis_lutea.AAC.3